MSRLITVLVSSLALVALSGTAGAQTAPRQGAGGGYDYYAFILSWSPAYCEREGNKADPEECGAKARPGFVTRGLAPLRDAGPRPESCPTKTIVPGSIFEAAMEIMPSAGAVARAWEKYGSCTGMTPDDYFAETRATWERVAVPPELADPAPGLSVAAGEVKQRFLEVNDLFQLRPEQIAVICERKRVSEVRVCLDKELDFRACGADTRDTCRPDERLTVR